MAAAATPDEATRRHAALQPTGPSHASPRRSSAGRRPKSRGAVKAPCRSGIRKATTQSGMPVKRLYTPADTCQPRLRARPGLPWAVTPTRAACSRRCIAPSRGRCACFAGFGTAEETNERFPLPAEAGAERPSQSPLIWRRSTATTTITRWRSASSASAGWPSPHWRIWRSSSTASPAGQGHHLDDHQQSSAGDLGRCISRRRRSRGVPMAQLRRHAAERHPQRVHRAEGVPFSPPGAFDAPGGGYHRVRHAATHAAVEHPSRSPATNIREAGATAVQELAFTLGRRAGVCGCDA